MTFRIKSTAVEVSFWFAAVLTFLLLFTGNSAAVCFLFCILHESGHLAAMLFFGSVPRKLELGYFGMKIVTGSRLLSPQKEIIIAAAGPAVNVLLTLIIIYRKEWALMSLALAVFNLIPVPMLDGGRILANRLRDEKTVKIIGISFSVGLFILGAAVAVYTKRNFTLLVVSLYLLTGTAIQ